MTRKNTRSIFDMSDQEIQEQAFATDRILAEFYEPWEGHDQSMATLEICLFEAVEGQKK